MSHRTAVAPGPGASERQPARPGGLRLLALVGAVVVATVGCSVAAPSSTPVPTSAIAFTGGGGLIVPPSSPVTLTGVGVTFPVPLYQEWFSRYSATYPSVTVTYRATGSADGIAALAAGTTNFAAVDIPLTSDQLATFDAGRTVLHVPTALGAVVLAYNLPGVGGLQLDAPTVAGIFLGTIGSWNDPQIVALNNGVALPGQPIVVVHRSDPAGTTAALTTYIDAGSPQWHSSVGVGPAVTWPTGSSAIGDDGVAQAITQTQGAIGYTTLSFAAKSGLASAALKNPAGQFVKASTISIAAPGDVTSAGFPADLRADPLVNGQGVHSYPIVAYAYLLIDKDQPDLATAKALVSLITWSLTNGQVDDGPNGYAPLPGPVQQKVLAELHTVTSGGSPVWP